MVVIDQLSGPDVEILSEFFVYIRFVSSGQTCLVREIVLFF